MSLVKPGTYAAHPERLNAEKHADVYESPNSGNLVLCQAFRLDDTGHTLKSWTALTQGGAPRQRTIDDLKARYGWDGVDPWWFETADLSGVQVELVIEDEAGNDGRTYSKIKWVNTPGGRGGGQYESKGDKRQLGAKYGALFRACAGPQPVKTGAKAPPAPTAPKPPAPPAPRTAVRPSDLPECWNRMCKAMAKDSQDEITKKWFEIHAEVCPGKTQDDFTSEDWGRVYARILVLEEALDGLPY